jgi:predicted nucleic acid-binding Zn ribbon protein
MFCSKCGKTVENDAKFCESCGEPQNAHQITSKTLPFYQKHKKPLLVLLLVVLVSSTGIFGFQHMQKIEAEKQAQIKAEVEKQAKVQAEAAAKAEAEKQAKIQAEAAAKAVAEADKVDNNAKQSSLNGSKYNKEQFNLVASCLGFYASLTNRGVASSEIITQERGRKFIALGYMDLLGATKKCGNSSLNECRPKLTTDEYNFGLEFSVRKAVADRKAVEPARVAGAFICATAADLLN